MRIRRMRHLAAIALVVGPFSWIATACSKQEPAPAPAPAATEEEEKPKKKKKKSEDDDTPDTGSGADEAPTAPAPAAPKVGGGGAAKPSTSDADKNKLIACCTALRNAATAAGIASAAASNIPGMPAPPPKDELDKNVKACDSAVVSWNGDLNDSLKKVKGASPAKLPSVCTIAP